eukprot:CAMPEP_0117566484 /NCGR_PEP_ID=MMETSP0784-20121206/57115_1 /TAXON_ID=39447 /ORGANISM="" /LENGTH=154 /DNA_ID=CAMNT_0005364325 /DNA_START=63 /DNA_END=527 /DNA_ORIENTATION=-
MSMLAAASRRANGVTPRAFQLLARRHLGDGVRGPAISDLAANGKLATNFFTKGAVSYAEYKQQCVSLRLFVVPGVIGACALSLMLDPPKSSYWMRYSPAFLFQNLKSLFLGGSAPPIFLSAKAEHETDAPDVVRQLITNRRLDKSGSDSEEEDH